jgi:phosphomannomutase / phosphoglucomutase
VPALSQAIFREYDIRGISGTELTEETATLIGRGFASLLAERGVKGEIAVGRDNRPSGAALERALIDALLASGYDVVEIGVVPTPTVYWTQHNLKIVAAIQVTASHNPSEYNGFKLGLGTNSLYGKDIQRVYDLAVAGKFPQGKGKERSEEVLSRYVADVVGRIGKLSRPLKVVLDCGNGVGSVAVPLIFPKLGIEPRCLFCESDGTFPNHHPDPTVEKNLVDLIRAVREDKADVGIAFDADADRVGVVDGDGSIIWGDILLVLFGRDVLKRADKGASVIFDVKCSQALPEMITKAGGTPVMWRTGHSLIEEKMHETHAPLAGEMSGHMFFAEGYYGFDDALYAGARLLKIVADSGKSVKELLADVPRFASTPEIRVECPDDVKFGIVDKATRHFSAGHQVITVDGVRVQYPDGWGLIRASNTQPVIVMRFEARTAEHLAVIRDEMEGWLREQGVKV